MRGAVRLTVILAAVAVCLGAPELLAQSKPAMVPSMAARPDIGQLQAAAWEWVTGTITSPQFLIGLGCGIVLAEGSRFLLRWLLRAIGFAASAYNLIVRYRLIAVAIVGAVYYVGIFHLLSGR